MTGRAGVAPLDIAFRMKKMYEQCGEYKKA
jgi:hypothetical protein